ncbi:MAG: primosomal protein N' [Armatimonadota bacterium]|nr:primosomal protein N' [Armatimonadota bacterium]
MMASNTQRSLDPEISGPGAVSATGNGVSGGPYVTVALDCGQSHFDKELTYGVPPALRSILRVGFAVLVPFNRRLMTGYVTGFTDHLDFAAEQLRPIRQLVSKAPLFDAKALKLARWMSAYYHCPVNECLDCFVPRGWQVVMQQRYSLAAPDQLTLQRTLRDLYHTPRQFQLVQVLMQHARPLTQKEIEKACEGAKMGDALKKLVAQGVLLMEEELLDPDVKPRRVQAVRLLPGATLNDEQWAQLDKAAPRQAAALRQLYALRDSDASHEAGRNSQPVPTLRLAHDFGIDLGALRALEKKGYIEFLTVEQKRAPVPHLPPPDVRRVELTAEQNAAVEKIETALRSISSSKSEALSTFLLQGITASGKTEVYLTAIERCLALGRRALVLVPEIALTAQTVEIFQRRFQERVAILHSALSAGERFDEWRRARSGRADIVVGARSAIFAPCRDIGLIIIDEEHDHSYKQDSTPRYHARDVALKRATLENAVVVLGSATPSLESYHHAVRGDFGHVKLTQRIGTRRLPQVEVVDMLGEARMGTLPVLGQRLKEALCEAVARGEQAIVFLNRRGFATYVQCLGCAHVERCPNCDVTLTFHRTEQALRCHHCDHNAPVRGTCPQCNGWMIGFTGTGTEKVENEVETLLRERGLEGVKILRLDRDTTTHKGSHGRILGEFRQGKAQVLIGTQMVTKGLDFPNVTVVGVISADSALNVPDFRASERTFQLLAQVAGRAGRGDQPGKVLIQTLTTDHYAIQAACEHDYEKFVEHEIPARQSPTYPPFSHIVNVISSDTDEKVARERIEELALRFHEAIAREGDGTELLGPVDCPLARVKNKYRFHLMLRDRNRPRLHRVLQVYDDLPREEREGLTIDVDAMTIL